MKKILSVGITMLALGIPVQVQADPVSITNASFESPSTLTVDSSGPPTGWTEGLSGGTGVWNINAFPAGFWTVPAPDGDQVAFLSDAPAPGSPATLSQVLSATVAANTRYDLSGFVGHPIGFPTIYAVNLYAGIFTVATTGPAMGPVGSFTTFDISFDSTLFPLLIGQPLRIELVSLSAQTAFDDITLEAVPDGGLTALLLGMGLTGLGWMRRKV